MMPSRPCAQATRRTSSPSAWTSSERRTSPFPAGDERLEQPPALPQRQSAQIAAIEIEEVKGIEDDRTGFDGRRQAPERPLQHAEIGAALIVQNGRLAIEDRRLHGEPPSVVDNRGEAFRPIVAAAREDPHPAGLDVHGWVRILTRGGRGSIGAVSRGFFEDALAIRPLTHRPEKSRIDSFG